MIHTPAKVLRQCLIDADVVDMPGGFDVDVWPAYVPDMPTDPNDAVQIRGTAGMLEGRINRTGEYVRHPGIQIRVRAFEFARGDRQAHAILNALAAINNTEVTVVDEDGEADYKISSFHLTSDLTHLGKESQAEANRERENLRELWTINGTLTLKEVA